MRVADEAQRRRDRDIGVADAVAEPVVGLPRRAVGLERRQHADICVRQRVVQTSEASLCSTFS
jgi:hypothetical protein